MREKGDKMFRTGQSGAFLDRVKTNTSMSHVGKQFDKVRDDVETKKKKKTERKR